LATLTYPCLPWRDDTQIDPWAANPSVLSTFSNFTAWKCSDGGILSEQSGHVTFDTLYLLDNLNFGIQHFVTNMTRENVVVSNAIIVGKSSYASNKAISDFAGNAGIISPKTDGILYSGISFHNYYTGMTPL